MRSILVSVFASLSLLGSVSAFPTPAELLRILDSTTYPADHDVKPRAANFGLGAVPNRALAPREDLHRNCSSTLSHISRSSFKQPDALAIVLEFCADKTFWNMEIVPAVSAGTGQTKSGKAKVLGIHASYPINDGKDLLWVGLKYSEMAVGGGFFPSTQGDTDGEIIENCKNAFMEVVNGCDTAGLDPKWGGAVSNSYGTWSVACEPKTLPYDPIAPKNGPASLGAFRCADTDTSAIGGAASPLAGTCTCWYEHLRYLQDTFCRPAGGCKAILGPPAWSTIDEKC